MFEIENFFANFLDAPAPLAKDKWERVYEDMTVHTQGKKPERIIETRRPYEDEAIKAYRLESYEPITKGAINRAIQNLQRLFSSSSYRWKVDESVAAYVSASEFKDKDFVSYIASDVVRRMIEDPNGFLVWWPTGEGLIEPTVTVEPQPVLVLSERVKIADGDSIVWLSNEKSEVMSGRKRQMKGNVYYVASRSGFFKFSQFGDITKKRYELIEVYRQEFDYAPYIQLGGEATEVEIKGEFVEYFESYFSSYLAFANDAIRQYSDHQAIMVTSAFPIREMEPITCTAEGCNDGWIYDQNDRSKRHKCGACNGTGQVMPPSPYGTLLRPKPDGMGAEVSSAPALRYISPDVGIVEYSGKHWEMLLEKAEKELNLIFIDEAQSGVAKAIDREDKEASIDRIGANVYTNIIKNSLLIIGDLITMGAASEPVIYLPPTFRIKTEAEMIDEITTLRKEGAPDFVLSEATKDFLQRRYGSNPNMIRAVEILSELDSFFALSTEEKNTLLAQGAISEREYLYSINAPRVLMKMARRDEFMDMGQDQIERELEQQLRVITNQRPTGGALAD